MKNKLGVIARLIFVLVIIGQFLAGSIMPAQAYFPQLKGLAMVEPRYQGELDALMAPIDPPGPGQPVPLWWYVWGLCPTGYLHSNNCVPMIRAADNLFSLPQNYNGYIILFNEPDRPDQDAITEQTGVDLYKQVYNYYPFAHLVVGNVFYPFTGWMANFRDICAADPGCVMPEIWGIHGYWGDPSTVSNWKAIWDTYEPNFTGRFWVTEFACVDVVHYSLEAQLACDQYLVERFQSDSRIDRYAYFSNRANPWDMPWWETELFDKHGNINARGLWYQMVDYVCVGDCDY